VSERGTLYGELDLGGRFEDRRFGYRINAAAADLHSYVRGADGERQFVSAAFDWQISAGRPAAARHGLPAQGPDHRARLPADPQRDLPTGVSAKMLLNDQPWTRPVDTQRQQPRPALRVPLAPDWRATVSRQQALVQARRLHRLPLRLQQRGRRLYPGYCSNGDYDVYDYQSVGERKTAVRRAGPGAGPFATGAMRTS
jgi:iron complex outermembrane receptor protein